MIEAKETKNKKLLKTKLKDELDSAVSSFKNVYSVLSGLDLSEDDEYELNASLIAFDDVIRVTDNIIKSYLQGGKENGSR